MGSAPRSCQIFQLLDPPGPDFLTMESPRPEEWAPHRTPPLCQLPSGHSTSPTVWQSAPFFYNLCHFLFSEVNEVNFCVFLIRGKEKWGVFGLDSIARASACNVVVLCRN